MGFTLLNGLQIIELFRNREKDRKHLLPIYLYNLVVFGAFSVQVLFAPQTFLNVAPAVNAFVHGTSFLGSFSITIFGVYIEHRIAKDTPSLTALNPLSKLKRRMCEFSHRFDASLALLKNRRKLAHTMSMFKYSFRGR